MYLLCADSSLDQIFCTPFLYLVVTVRVLLSGPTYPIFSSYPRYLNDSPSFSVLIITPLITVAFWLSTIFPWSLSRKANLDSRNSIPMSVENYVTKSNC